MRFSNRAAVSALGLVGAAFLASAAHAGVPEDIKKLIEQGRPQEAYELGFRHPELIGQPLFDYYFGVAAIDGGRASLGVFSLERFLLRDPSNDLARLELARGYYVTGDFQRARREFDVVLAKKPPAGVRDTVQRFLDDINRQERSRAPKLTGFAEQGFGYNTNANGGLSTSRLDLPLFGLVDVGPQALGKKTGFAATAGAARYQAPLSKTVKASVSATASRLANASLKGFDQTIGDASAGIEWNPGKTQISASVGGGMAMLGSARYRRSAQAGAALVYPVTKKTDVGLNLSVARLGYYGAAAPRAADLSAVSLGVTQQIDVPTKPAVSLQLTAGREANRRGRAELSRDIAGGYGQVMLSPFPSLSLAVGGGNVRSNYDGADPLFGIRREDRLTTVDLAVGYRFSANVSARIEGAYTDNRSNISLYEFRQSKAGVTIRYAWN